MNFSKKSFLLFFTFALVLVLAACSGEDSSTDGTTDKEKNNEVVETKNELVLEVLSEAVELDPHGSNDVPSANVQANIFETLVARNFETSEIEPVLAESWKQVDELTLELKLRKGVKFHDGTNFNAEAVKINYDRLLDPAIASPRATNFEPIKEIIVVDEYTIHITTEEPYGPLLATLTHPGGYIISPAVIAEDYKQIEAGKEPRAYINANPVGTGFLKFDSWAAGQQIKLVKNTDYWGQQVAYESAVFKTIPESATRAADLEAGYAHIIDPVQPTEVSHVESVGEVIKQPSISIAYLGFNTQKAPLDNVKVRQAISKAVDRETIISGVYDGFGVAAFGPLSPAVWGYSEEIFKQDFNIEEAKQLLADAGYADGFDINLWTNDNPQRQQIAIVLQEKLKELKINVNIEVLEWGAYLEKTATGDHDLFLLGWSPSTGDADNALYPLFHSSDAGNNNRTFYSNLEVDKLLDAGRTETDEVTRADIYKQAQDIISEEAPAAFIIHVAYLTGVSKDVEGFTIDASGIYHLEDVKFK